MELSLFALGPRRLPVTAHAHSPPFHQPLLFTYLLSLNFPPSSFQIFLLALSGHTWPALYIISAPCCKEVVSK